MCFLPLPVDPRLGMGTLWSLGWAEPEPCSAHSLEEEVNSVCPCPVPTAPTSQGALSMTTQQGFCLRRHSGARCSMSPPMSLPPCCGDPNMERQGGLGKGSCPGSPAGLGPPAPQEGCRWSPELSTLCFSPVKPLTLSPSWLSFSQEERTLRKRRARGRAPQPV